MTRKDAFVLTAVAVLILLTGSCVKETYDLNRLDETMSFSPTLVLSAVSGEVTLVDIVKPDDTIQYDDDDLLKIMFRQDSVFNFEAEELLEIDDIFSFNEAYRVGVVSINDEESQLDLPLGTIVTWFDPALRTEFESLDDGDPHPFPAFPETDIGNHTLPIFGNFEYATFAGGELIIEVTNELSAALSGARVSLFNSADNSPIGNEVNIPAIAAGATHTTPIDLTGKTLTNSIYASIILEGSPGTTDPVIISMNDLISIKVTGSDMRIDEGRIILPEQLLAEFEDDEYVTFDPGNDMEITEFRLTEGSINYNIQSELDININIDLTLPTVNRGGTLFTESLVINPNSTITGTFSANNMHALLDTDIAKPYNTFPVSYNIVVSSQGSYVDFNSNDQITFILELPAPEIDFVKGYFGQMSEEFEADTVDIKEVEEFYEQISGDFFFADPSISIDYHNSFSLPVELNLAVTGKRSGVPNVNLGLAPFTISYPNWPTETDKHDIFTIGKDNSSLPELISLPPSEIIFGGTATLNPSGNTGSRDNVILGNSRVVGDLEICLPMDLWISNLQFADTLDNFMRIEEDPENEDDFNPEDLDYVRLDLTVTNGFPLGVSVALVLYDSLSAENLYTLDIPGIIEPAPVNASGRVTGNSEKKNQIVLEKEFFTASQEADKVILEFTLNTTGSGSQSVKIYSDYTISFKAGVAVKPDIIVNK